MSIAQIHRVILGYCQVEFKVIKLTTLFWAWFIKPYPLAYYSKSVVL